MKVNCRRVPAQFELGLEMGQYGPVARFIVCALDLLQVRYFLLLIRIAQKDEFCSKRVTKKDTRGIKVVKARMWGAGTL